MSRLVFRVLVLIFLLEAGVSADTRFTHLPVNVAGVLVDYVFLDVTGDGVADLLVLSRNENRLAVQVHHTRRGIGFSGDPNQTVELPKGTMAVWAGIFPAPVGKAIVVLTVDGVFFLPGRKNYFPNTRWKSLYSARCWDLRKVQEPGWMPFIRSLGNGALELVVPQSNGFKAIVKSRKNLSASPLLSVEFQTGAATPKRYGAGEPWFGLLWKDINHDSIRDLVWVDERQCRFVLGSKNGFTDGVKGGFNIPRGGRILGITESTGDGVPDVFLVRDSEPGLFKTKELNVSMFSGQRERRQISFRGNPDQVWEFEGVQVVPRLVDYNADGKSDLVVSVVAFTVGNVISSLLRSSIKYQIRFYPARDGTIHRRPAMVRESVLDGKIYNNLAHEPLMGFGDVTGDGFQDFILGMENTIFCFRGDKQGRFQFGAYDGIRKALSEDARLRVFDADADHRDDLCIKEYTSNSSILHFYLAR